ncbi:MAG: DoxX-like family protein [Chitinophagales bacterium]|nr:DoxX-like family protein [Chitinophagales bacterium]
MPPSTQKIITYFIAVVWLANGLFCKVLHLVPRHEAIVSRILGEKYATETTLLIGIAEIIMAFWVMSHFKRKLNAILQMIIVGVMNILEFLLTPDLLLWGRFNLLFACLFILLIYYSTFILPSKSKYTR